VTRRGKEKWEGIYTPGKGEGEMLVRVRGAEKGGGMSMPTPWKESRAAAEKLKRRGSTLRKSYLTHQTP